MSPAVFEPVFQAGERSQTHDLDRAATDIVTLSLYRPLRLQEVEAPRISRQSAHEGGKFVRPTHRPPLPPRRSLWHKLVLEAESTPRP
jgi:hypothetical protein